MDVQIKKWADSIVDAPSVDEMHKAKELIPVEHRDAVQIELLRRYAIKEGLLK